MPSKFAYGSAYKMIEAVMQDDVSLTIKQLHIITGVKRDTIIKMVLRRGFKVERFTQRGQRGCQLRVCARSSDLLNEWLLKGIVRHGSKND